MFIVLFPFLFFCFFTGKYFILILIFFTSCEYKPIYSNSNKSNYKIIVTELSGDKKLNKFLVENLKELNIKDFGTNDEESCDFPDFASKVCDFVLNDTSFRGLLICGSGVGMSIAANKIKGIRASNVTNEDMAIQSVEHNNVNVLCLGSNNVSKADSLKIVLSFLNSEMSNDEKYQRRINKLED